MSISHLAARRRGRGFSLIELMIAMLLGLLVLAGLINVLLANRQAFHLQESNNFNQQNMRYVSSRIGWALRMSDFWAGVRGPGVRGSAAASGPGACNASWILNAAQSIHGHDGAATFPLAGCVHDDNYVKGSDILIVRYADPSAADPTSLVSEQVYVATAAGEEAQLFTGSDGLPGSVLGTSLQQIVFPYMVEMYYLQPCSDRGADGRCGTADDGDADARIPTLARLRLASNGTMVSEPLVEGVEQLQFEYAINSAAATGQIIPSDFRNATAVGANWNNVIAVRINTVTRSQTRDSMPHVGTYVVSGDCRYSVAADGAVTATGCTGMATGTGSSLGDAPAQYTRQLSTELVQVRNRTRG